MARYRTATRALEAIPTLAARGGRAAPLRMMSIAEAQAELARGAAIDAALVTIGEPDFPTTLAALDPPPPLLWRRGHVDLLQSPCIAIVGARIASAAGQRFARQLAAELGDAGHVIVSGLARGIDGAAHEGGLATGTAAVLAGGVDDIYPPEHAALYGRILEAGCIVSESPVGRAAKAQDFPRRNRIISGLSLAVVVVEAELRSGSLITARLAAEQGREVLAVPGFPLDPRSRGTNDLIRQGAAVCESAADVLEAVRRAPTTQEPQRDLFDLPPADEGELAAAAERLRERALALTSDAAVPIEEIVRALHAPAPEVFAALVELAIAGRVELLPGALVRRA